MATSSFNHNVDINNKEDAEKLINAIEKSELYAYRNTRLTPEEIKDHEEMFKAYRHICGSRSPEDIKRALELLDAEKQGYLIKLPCKVRDLLYEPKTNCTEQITDIEVVFKAGGREFKHSDIGEAVFLTREAALKGRNNHGR